MALLSEPTVNQVLARILRRKRRAWEEPGVLEAEPLQALQSRAQPDILIAEPGRDPVVIELEIEPAVSVEKDAASRIGAVTRTGDRIRTAIAVRLPQEWRSAETETVLEELIEHDTVEWAVIRGVERPEQRWPERGWITSKITTLAFAAYESTVSHLRVAEASERLTQVVSSVGNKLAQMAKAGYEEALKGIAEKLHQIPNEQTWSMAALIMANAMAFHDLLAGRGNLAHVPTLAVLRWQRNGHLEKDDVVAAWESILDEDYVPIFEIAHDVLVLVPTAFANQILNELDRAVTDAGLRTLVPSHDVLSHTFQRLITDRKKLASFYTLPETASLLAALAMPVAEGPSGIRWGDAEALANITIADYACGTGMLLAAAYRRMCWLHEAYGGDAGTLHGRWMENGLIGLDVLPAASHLTATVLSGVHPLTQYNDSQVYIARYGPTDSGVALGSLELLDNQFRMSSLVSLATRVGARRTTQTDLSGELRKVDLCIMNPPYTRNTNHEAERARDALPAFAAFGIPEATQKRMSRRMKLLTRGTFAHGNAGISSAFLAVADRMTKDGGTIAMVLPLTFLSGSSWSRARDEISRRYESIVLVTIAGVTGPSLGFSADTDMAECLLVARKTGQSSLTKRAIMVCLDDRPATELAATVIAEYVTNIITANAVRRLEDAPVGGTEVQLGESRVGSLLSVPLDWGHGWAGARVADFSLAQTAYHLANGRAWLPGVEEGAVIEVPITSFGNIAQLGPLHRDITGKETSRKTGAPRGPFEVSPIFMGEVPTYPMLWEHRAEREVTLEFPPDCKGVVRPNADPKKLAKIVKAATHLHMNLDWRFNSQPLQAQWTPVPAIGGTAWPSVLVHPHARHKRCNPAVERAQAIALLLWMNSTPGALLRWFWSNRQQNGRGRLTREVVPTLPVLDVRKLTAAQLARCEEVFRSLRDKPLRPLHQVPEDATRAAIDFELLAGVLGWRREWFAPNGPLDLLRRKLAAEPSVHGHIRSVKPAARARRLPIQRSLPERG